jgi:hypothetical protein
MVLFASDYDKSKYLRAEDIKGDKKFRIKAVTEEVFEKDGKAEKKLVCWFTNDDRGLVLNKTNNLTIRGAYGDDTAKWDGKIIVVYPTTEPFRGKMTPCLRVRIPPPKQAAAAPQLPVTSGNGAVAAPVAAATPPQAAASGSGALPAAALVAAAVPLAVAALTAADDPELDPDPVKPIGDDLDDEIGF